MTEALRLAQRCIDLADGDLTKGKLLAGSPLAQATMMRGLSRLCLGIDGCAPTPTRLSCSVLGWTARVMCQR